MMRPSRIIGLLISYAGYGILFFYNWKIGFGVALCICGHNLWDAHPDEPAYRPSKSLAEVKP